LAVVAELGGHRRTSHRDQTRATRCESGPIASGENDLFGFKAGEFRIAGDLELPLIPTEEWEVMKK
jgi:hypothetical protein